MIDSEIPEAEQIELTFTFVRSTFQVTELAGTQKFSSAVPIKNSFDLAANGSALSNEAD